MVVVWYYSQAISFYFAQQKEVSSKVALMEKNNLPVQ